MAKVNDGGPAFPRIEIGDEDKRGVTYVAALGGLSVRQWYAGQALVLIDHNMRSRDLNMSYEQIAKVAFEIADAMIANESPSP